MLWRLIFCVLGCCYVALSRVVLHTKQSLLADVVNKRSRTQLFIIAGHYRSIHSISIHKWRDYSNGSIISQVIIYSFITNGYFLGVVGVCDGTHVHILVPADWWQETIPMPKRLHIYKCSGTFYFSYLEIMFVVDAEGLFTHFDVTKSGSAYDSHILWTSQLWAAFEDSTFSAIAAIHVDDCGRINTGSLTIQSIALEDTKSNRICVWQMEETIRHSIRQVPIVSLLVFIPFALTQLSVFRNLILFILYLKCDSSCWDSHCNWRLAGKVVSDTHSSLARLVCVSVFGCTGVQRLVQLNQWVSPTSPILCSISILSFLINTHSSFSIDLYTIRCWAEWLKRLGEMKDI